MGARFATILCCELLDPALSAGGADDGQVVVRRDYLRTLRRALLSHEGRELRRTGSGLVAIFQSAVAALRCAVDMQRACASLGQLSLSVGLDAGEPLEGYEEQDGLAAVAARLCEAAAPGEILATHVVCQVAGARAAGLLEPADSLRVRGIAQRIRVSRVRWDADAPAPLTATATAAARSAVSVVIAGGHRLTRAGLRQILAADASIQVLGEAADGRAAVDLVRRARPHVALMDLHLPELDGLEAARRIVRDPDLTTAVLMLTTSEDDEDVYEALRLGVSGFLLEDASGEQLLEAVRAAAAGDALLAPSITRRLIAEYARGAPLHRDLPQPLQLLTARELEVLRLMARGLSNAEIAAELVLAESTVKTHVARLLDKLGLRDRVQAVVVAYESGLVSR